MLVYPCPKFQFHIGAIKSLRCCLPTSRGLAFQFHIGAIKSGADFFDKGTTIEFQFHIGAIKRGHCSEKGKLDS